MINKEVTNMNKKEVLEIRKQFSPENCAITSVDAMSITKKRKKWK
mgnify:CR=1 FL=1